MPLISHPPRQSPVIRPSTILLLLSAYTLVRALWLYVTYPLMPDVATQMQVALNILHHKGIVFEQAQGGIVTSTRFNHFPPGGSFILLPFQPFTGDIILSDFLARVLISLLEGWIVVHILAWSHLSVQGIVAVTLASSLYVGHLDRSGTTEFACAMLGLWLMFLTYRRIREGRPFGFGDGLALCLASACLPLMKYNAFPVALTPIAVFLYFGLIRREWQLARREWGILTLAGALSVGTFLLCVRYGGRSQTHLSMTGEGLAGRDVQGWLLTGLDYLGRIDYFWLHLGRNVDMYLRIAYTRLAGYATPLHLLHVLQVSTAMALLALLFLLRRKSGFQRALVTVATLFVLSHVAFLAFMTLLVGPFDAVGVAGKGQWVLIEEPRLYSHLTLGLFLILLAACWRHLRPAYWTLVVIMGLNLASSLKGAEPNLPALQQQHRDLARVAASGQELHSFDDRQSRFIWQLLLVREVPAPEGRAALPSYR